MGSVSQSPGEHEAGRRVSRKAAAIAAAAYLCCVLAVFSLENISEIAERFDLPSFINERLLNAGYWYQMRMSLTPRPLEARFCVLVAFSREKGDAQLLSDACAMRRRFAEMLPKLAAASPAMIVSDITFNREFCGDAHPETQELQNSLAEARQKAPVILGRSSRSGDKLSDAQRAEYGKRGFHRDELLMLEPMVSPVPAAETGLVRLNGDLRKIPLEWSAHAAELQDAKEEPGLAMAAARRYREAFPGGASRLDKLLEDGRHPFTGFLEPGSFARVPAGDVVQAMTAAQADSIRGKIAVVGWDDDDGDLWDTVVGRLPGYMLHANYIESLLDDRAYRPIGLAWQIAGSILWFALIEVPFWGHTFSTGRALLYSIFISAIILFLLYYVALVNFGFYFGLWAPSAGAILTRAVYRVVARFEE